MGFFASFFALLFPGGGDWEGRQLTTVEISSRRSGSPIYIMQGTTLENERELDDRADERTLAGKKAYRDRGLWIIGDLQSRGDDPVVIRRSCRE